MARTRVTMPGIITIATTLVEEHGFEALSLSTVASSLGVRPSALYTHVKGVEGLRSLVAVSAIGNLTAELRRAAIGVGGGEALQAVGHAYRRFATEFPGPFRSTLTPWCGDNDAVARANRELIEVFSLIFLAMGLDEETAQLAARSNRSALHGFCVLEATMGTTVNHDAEYQHLLDTLERGLQQPD